MPPQDVTDSSRKLLAGTALKIRIAAGSVLLLAAGAWLAPRAAQTTLSVPQEHAAPLLEEQVQIREASRTFTGVQEVAAQAGGHSVAILSPSPRAIPARNDYTEPVTAPPPISGFGVYISDTQVMTHASALNGRSSIELNVDGGLTRAASVIAYDAPTGLVLLETEPTGRSLVPMAIDPPSPGGLAAAIGRNGGGQVVVPAFVTGAGSGTLTIGAVEPLLPGMPLFTLTGELFALAAPDAIGGNAVPARAAAERLMALAASGERRSAFGLGFQAAGGSLARVFGDEGVVIAEVLTGGPAAAAGIEVGDVLLGVGDVSVDSIDAATRALNTATLSMPAVLHLRRAGRPRDVEVTPALAYEVAAMARAAEPGVTGPEARTLFPPAVLEQAGIPPAARVLSVNGRSLTSAAQAQRELRVARAPVPVLLRVGTSQFFVTIEPAQ